ncbi:hypothetical protein [Pseudonocardia sp. WMMC193]|uniref:hypothetical protein n=1 Tax=Pseudonocardia sp. WMMC193 TaxID=2911965 RepID=UPI001F2A47D1|nr:hypothetical protein [Pseudonocardia sp. WMMC193]MCF7547169.1 hypothetical protein [Pseudonocardia sp. WMMC193]MCF7547263.1 hypothetical protein [Pseudonocardia sp. WMMC193]
MGEEIGDDGEAKPGDAPEDLAAYAAALDLVGEALEAILDAIPLEEAEEGGSSALGRLFDDLGATVDSISIFTERISPRFVKPPEPLFGTAPDVGVAQRLAALQRLGDLLPARPRPSSGAERREWDRNAQLRPVPAWRRTVWADLLPPPLPRTWEDKADRAHRLYLVAWGDGWVKYGHGTDARIREHLVDERSRVLQVLQARHADVVAAERALQARLVTEPRPSPEQLDLMPRSFVRGTEVVPAAAVRGVDLMDMLADAVDVTEDYPPRVRPVAS